MGNQLSPFKIDVAGAFLLPQSLKEANEQYRNEQISSAALRAIEDDEIRNLVERLKVAGLTVATDGRFRSKLWPLDFMSGFEGIRFCPTKKSSLELIGRIDLHHHPVLHDFMFLTGITGGDVIAKQVLPAPSRLFAELLKEDNREQLNLIYPDIEVLLEDIATAYRKLILELYESGCRYLQFDDMPHSITDNALRVNNMALEDHPQDLLIAFHAPLEMLFSTTGIDTFFLDYDFDHCDKNRLIWFIRQRKSTFGFVLSHYPVEEELDELRAKIDEITRYIPLTRFSLCIPNARVLPSETYSSALAKQWDTLAMAGRVAQELW